MGFLNCIYKPMCTTCIHAQYLRAAVYNPTPSKQWRIQNFSGEGPPTPEEDQLFGNILAENCMEMKEIE